MRAEATARFGELVARPEDQIPLDETAALIGFHGEPEVDVAAVLAGLDALAARCPAPTLAALTGHLFGDLGFAGNGDDYRDPRNSYLHAVLDRRLGIPITLSVVTMEVGRRLGVPLAGVGMPAHFLVRHLADPPVFLDPFDGGARMDEAGCEALYRTLGGTGAWNPAWLDPVGPRAILTRMLANLSSIFLPADLRNATWVLNLRLLIPGLRVPEQIALARALGSLGHYEAAAGALERAAGTAPPDEADRLRAQSRALRARSN